MSKTFQFSTGSMSPVMPEATRRPPDLWDHVGIGHYAKALLDAVKAEFPDHVVDYPLPPFPMFPQFTTVIDGKAYWNETAMLQYGKMFANIFIRAIQERIAAPKSSVVVGYGLTRSEGPDIEVTDDWASLSKRLIGAMHYGIRIEHESGHRWIQYDRDADNWPKRAFSGEVSCTKEYGSYVAALDFIDAELSKQGYDSLVEVFDGINHYEDLGVVFGEGVQ